MIKIKHYKLITCIALSLSFIAIPFQVHAQGYNCDDVPTDKDGFLEVEDLAEYDNYYLWYNDKEYQQSRFNTYQVKHNTRVAFSFQSYKGIKYTDSTKTTLLSEYAYNMYMFVNTENKVYYYSQIYINSKSKWNGEFTQIYSPDSNEDYLPSEVFVSQDGITRNVLRGVTCISPYYKISYDDNDNNDCLARTNIPVFDNDYDAAIYVQDGTGLEKCLNISDVMCDDGQIYDTRDNSIYDGTLPTFQACNCHINRDYNDNKKYQLEYNYTLPSDCTKSDSQYYMEITYNWSYQTSIKMNNQGLYNFSDNQYSYVTKKNCNNYVNGFNDKTYDIYKNMSCSYGVIFTDYLVAKIKTQVSSLDPLATKYSYPCMVNPVSGSIGVGDIVDGLQGLDLDAFSLKTQYSTIKCTIRICKDNNGVITKGNKNNFYINLVDNTVECDIAKVSEDSTDKTVVGSYSDTGSIGDISNNTNITTNTGGNNISININNTNNGSSDSGSSGGSSGGIDGSLFGQIGSLLSNIEDGSEGLLTGVIDIINICSGDLIGSIESIVTATGSILSLITSGFGILGDNGLFELFKQTFSFIPSEIWSLIGLGLSVSLGGTAYHQIRK